MAGCDPAIDAVRRPQTPRRGGTDARNKSGQDGMESGRVLYSAGTGSLAPKLGLSGSASASGPSVGRLWR
jgi:hypothetical protein